MDYIGTDMFAMPGKDNTLAESDEEPMGFD
jgi:hypothetical protein